MIQFFTLPTILQKRRLQGLVLGALLTAGSAQAQSGNALNFDGINDYVSVPASLTTGVTNFTFEAWLNYQDNGPWTRIMDFGQNATVNMFLTPRNGANNAPRFAITTNGGGAEELLTSNAVLAAGQHHFAVTLSRNGTVVTGTLYVDGAVAATNTNMSLTPDRLGTLTQLFLGRSQYAADPYLKGDLDEVRIYSAALTQAQVQADMRTGTTAVPASLLAYYNFNQGTPSGNNPTVTTLLDRSSNARNGTLTNFALATGSTSNWIGGTAPLPVTLVSFTAQRQAEDGLLVWATASETNNAYFELESSSDGADFRTLGRVAGHGTTTQSHTYQFTDANVARYASAMVYYRLRQIDLDGASTYSPVRTLQVPVGSLAVAAFPSRLLAGQTLSLQVRTPLGGPARLLVTDALGRTVLQQPLELPSSTTTIALPPAAQWPQGLYLLRVQQGGRQQVAKVARE